MAIFFNPETFEFRNVNTADYIEKDPWVRYTFPPETFGGPVREAFPVPACNKKYWKKGNPVPTEMTPAEKQAVDDAEAAAAWQGRDADQILSDIFAAFTDPADQVQVVRAVTAGFIEALKRRKFTLCRILLDQAVADGDVTQAQADEIENKLPEDPS